MIFVVFKYLFCLHNLFKKIIYHLKREAVYAILNTSSKIASPISLPPINQQGSPSYHTFLMVTLSYNSKVTPVSTLYAEKIAEAVLLYVFRIKIPASLLPKTFMVTCVSANA